MPADQSQLQYALQNSVLIVAHPDDEILWFGSIARDVGRIVICFENDPTTPELAAARRATLAEHPYRDRLTWLKLEETCSFNKADWSTPDPTPWGLKITRDARVSEIYEKTSAELLDTLKTTITSANNVFTHNPWGEYGHEEHVMVCRAATEFANQSGASVWYDNYVSNWSHTLMTMYMDASNRNYIESTVDTEDMLNISDVYRKHGAWTWLEDYVWFSREIFIQGPLSAVAASSEEPIIPLNMIALAEKKTPIPKRRSSAIGRAVKKLTRVVKRLFASEPSSV